MPLQRTIKNRSMFCRDNLEALRGFDSNTVDLIYLDPPFNSKRQYHAPIGSQAEGASFNDIFAEADVKNEWLGVIADQYPAIRNLITTAGMVGHRSDKYYLAYMAIRLLEMQRVLSDTGSIYLHCDPTMSHWLKLLMDAIFGESHFRNEVVWKRREEKHNLATKHMGRSHDILFYYAKTEQHQYQRAFLPYDEAYLKNFYKYQDKQGRYRILPATNEAGGNQVYTFKNVTRAWRFSAQNMQKMYDEDLLVQLTPGGPFNYKKYLESAKGVPLQDIWDDIPPERGKRYLGYPTQKPLKLLERIIAASSNPGDVVLDPFCGCATTCVAAERLKREWVGIDVSPKAAQLVQLRLQEIVDHEAILLPELPTLVVRKDIPARTDGRPALFTLDNKHALYGAQEGNCALCKQHFGLRHLEIDHIVPKAYGGGDEPENTQLLCGHCNRVKGTRTNEQALARLRAMKIL